MIELKVYCDCGQKFKFDVEPVNGQMPYTVACPICNRDGTAKANQLLQQMAIFKPIGSPSETAPAPALAPMAPPPMAPPPTTAPPPAPAGAPRLRINVAAPAAESQHAAAAAPPPIAPPIGTLPPTSGRPRMGAAAATAGEPGKKPSFALGLLGALIGAVVGATVYFLIYKTTGPFPFLRYFLALGVGGLTGWLANLLGKGEGSKELGGLAAVFTIIGILGAQYFLELNKFRQEYGSSEITQAIEDGGYAENVKEANEVVKAIPTGSDAEIRMYIAKQQTDDGQAPKLEAVSADEVKQFRETELTNYQDLASGKLTKEQYWAKNGFDPKAARKALDTGETVGRGLVAIIAVLKAGIVSMIVGAGLAYKLSANA